jgi:hypothetical protein
VWCLHVCCLQGCDQRKVLLLDAVLTSDAVTVQIAYM